MDGRYVSEEEALKEIAKAVERIRADTPVGERAIEKYYAQLRN